MKSSAFQCYGLTYCIRLCCETGPQPRGLAKWQRRIWFAIVWQITQTNAETHTKDKMQAKLTFMEWLFSSVHINLLRWNHHQLLRKWSTRDGVRPHWCRREWLCCNHRDIMWGRLRWRYRFLEGLNTCNISIEPRVLTKVRIGRPERGFTIFSQPITTVHTKKEDTDLKGEFSYMV